MNPYAAPRVHDHRPTSGEPRRSPWRFFLYSFFFYPVWFFVGGLFSISGSERGLAVDVGLFVGVAGASVVTFLMGVAGEVQNAVRRRYE